MPRKQKKYHYIYKTTNVLNDKFYIGMHSTDDLTDGYVGSGKRLWYSINKHGKENHVCEILEYLPDRESLRKREEEIVNGDLLNEILCMNLVIGGGGSDWTAVNESGKNLYGKNGENGQKNFLPWDERKQKMIENGTFDGYIQHKREVFAKVSDWTGKSHTAAAKRKIGKSSSVHQSGEGNSQYGTCWVSNVDKQKCIKIKRDELEAFLCDGWIKKRITFAH